MTVGLVRAAYGHGTAMATLRRQFGTDPETGLVTTRTQGRILDAISGLPAEVSTGVGLSSVVAVIRGAHPGGVALLRADTDVIAATTAGHPGGYGVPAAALVGTARLLAERRHELSGDVVLAWQPGSAGHGGAARMLAEGLLDVAGRPVDAAYALRTLPGLPRGVVAVRSGPMLASADRLQVTIRDSGQGGGPARPVTVACQLAAALDRAHLGDRVTLTVDQISASGRNLDSATVVATVRTHHAAARSGAHEAVGRLVGGYATAHGMHAAIQWHITHPVTVNDAAEVAWIHRTVTEMYGRERLVQLRSPVALSDDFGYVLDAVPGALVLLLGAIPESDSDDMTLLPTAAALLAGLAIRRLAASRVTPPGVRRTRHRAAPTVLAVPPSLPPTGAGTGRACAGSQTLVRGRAPGTPQPGGDDGVSTPAALP
ncbi:MAG TPA: M20/M25/M40 family metallo-hydrolase [Micromonosporaceae bacterium]